MYVKCPQKLVMQIVKANYNYVNLHTESMLQDRRHYTVLKKPNDIYTDFPQGFRTIRDKIYMSASLTDTTYYKTLVSNRCVLFKFFPSA